MNGNTLGIAPVFTPKNASNKAVTWTSSDTAVATVDENGIVTAVADSGIAIITATSLESASIFDTKTITAIPFEASTVNAIEILEGNQITVDQYVNTPLTLQLTPESENSHEIEWTSSNDAIVSVLATGKVIGKIIGGTATITAKVKGTNISDEITVDVRIAGDESVFTRELPDILRPFTTGKLNVPITAMGNRTVLVEFIKDNVVFGTGTKSVNALGNKTVEVSYQLTSAPTPGAGYVIKLSLKDGDTVLDTETKTIEIIDHIRISSVVIDSGIPAVQVGKTITSTATALPADAFDTSIIWSSSNTAIATVNETTGVITGVAEGKTIVRATSKDVATVFDEVTIDVQSGAVSIAIESITIPTAINLFPGLKTTLITELSPEFTTDLDINWTSDNGIVTVDLNGVITAGYTDGTATITATSAADPAVFATCVVSVTKTIVIEAETFVNTGGASEGIVKSTVGFNNNTSGDWADYSVDIPVDGTYTIQYNIGSPNSEGLGVKTYVDGVLMDTTTLTGTTSWEIYTTQSGSGEIYISEGTHTIRFESTGTSTWQWNADWFSLTFNGTLSVGESILSTVSVYPNPTQDDVIITGLIDSSTITVLDIKGSVINKIKINDEKAIINLRNYKNGLYLIRVANNKSGFSNLYKIIKK